MDDIKAGIPNLFIITDHHLSPNWWFIPLMMEFHLIVVKFPCVDCIWWLYMGLSGNMVSPKSYACNAWSSCPHYHCHVRIPSILEQTWILVYPHYTTIIPSWNRQFWSIPHFCLKKSVFDFLLSMIPWDPPFDQHYFSTIGQINILLISPHKNIQAFCLKIG